MQADGIAAPPTLQHCQRSPSPEEKIFRMNFQKIQLREFFQQLRVVRMAPANANFQFPLGSTFESRHQVWRNGVSVNAKDA
jgi:hypothetical protein